MGPSTSQDCRVAVRGGGGAGAGESCMHEGGGMRHSGGVCGA